MSGFQAFKSIAPIGLVVGIAIATSTFCVQMGAEINSFSVAQSNGMNNRQDRWQDRQGDRTDRSDDRQDCRQEEGVAGKDKPNCKQDGRQGRNNDVSASNDG
jgi:hypothetical protein